MKFGSSKKAYLSDILDLYDGSIVSYVLGHSNNNNLVFKTLDQAIEHLNRNHPLMHRDAKIPFATRICSCYFHFHIMNYII
ncbi:hypothetical protein [Neobacillus sp. LXY-4]|uniref:hypothetical protein n=1 Tax=Neobacillus sp. LXY-4 TaxID=3379826 RepID=UPI003F4A2241